MLFKYLEVPFLLHGRTWQGADCYGLLMLYFATELGITVKDYIGTVRTKDDLTNNDLCLDNSDDEWLPVSLDDIQPNDILLLRNQSEKPNHVGVVIDPGHFLHTLDGAGAAVSKIPTWRHRMVTAYRHRRLVE